MSITIRDHEDNVLLAAAGRWADIVRVVGMVTDDYLEPGRHGPCPKCGGKDRYRPFDDFSDTGGTICNQCNPKGSSSGIGTIAWLLGIKTTEAVSLIGEYLGIEPPKPKANGKKSRRPGTTIRYTSTGTVVVSPEDVVREQIAERIAECTTEARAIGEVYLRSRGLSGELPERLHVHPGLPYYEGGQQTGTYPALIGEFTHPLNGVVAITRIYLAPDGNGKAPVSDPKKHDLYIADHAADGAVVLLDDWAEDMAIGEGIETMLAVREATGLSCAAATTANLLAKVTLPEIVRRVWIFADAGAVGMAAAQTLARRMQAAGVEAYLVAPPEERTTGKPKDWLDLFVERGAEFIRDTKNQATSFEGKAAVATAEQPLRLQMSALDRARLCQARQELTDIWNSAIVDHPAVIAYRESRGIHIDPDPNCIRGVDEWENWHDGEVCVTPAMVARVVDCRGALVGLHYTAISPDGHGKARLPEGFANKKFAKTIKYQKEDGSQAKVSLRGAYIDTGGDMPHPTMVGIADGIEDAETVRQELEIRCFATNRTGLETIQLDPRITEVLIFVDNDPDGGGRTAAEKAARRLTREGRTVKLVTIPAPYKDVNQLVQEGEDRALQQAVTDATVWDAVEPVNATEPSRIQPGDIVSPSDRGNWGEVLSVCGDRATVHFVSPSGHTATKDFNLSELRKPGELVAGSDNPPYKPRVITSAEFAAATYQREFLVKGILVRGEPCVIGGLRKTMKTTIGLDLAISLGTGTYFLGEFETRKANVGVFSGESGPATLQETAKRIAVAKHRTLSGASIWWGFELPRIARQDHLAGLQEFIDEHKIEVLLIDPLYLCLLVDAHGRSASNLYDMGALLLPLSELGQRTGCTILLMHHFRKVTDNDKHGPPELEDLAFSGIAEWARQWILLGRRSRYEEGSGRHDLWLTVGGSAGHSGCWAVDVDEGQPSEDLQQHRQWRVRVSTKSEARERAKESADAKRHEREREKILEALTLHPDGETTNVLKETAGVSGKVFNRHRAELMAEGIVEPCTVKKSSGTYDGYRLNPDKVGQGRTRSDSPTKSDPGRTAYIYRLSGVRQTGLSEVPARQGQSDLFSAHDQSHSSHSQVEDL